MKYLMKFLKITFKKRENEVKSSNFAISNMCILYKMYI